MSFPVILFSTRPQPRYALMIFFNLFVMKCCNNSPFKALFLLALWIYHYLFTFYPFRELNVRANPCQHQLIKFMYKCIVLSSVKPLSGNLGFSVCALMYASIRYIKSLISLANSMNGNYRLLPSYP